MKEEEIRPKTLREEFLRLSKRDIDTFFGPDKERIKSPCPACGRKQGLSFEFRKHGFDYVTCPECETLFANPRPRAADIDRYYAQSEAAEYWSTHLFKETEDARRKHLFAPKARMVADIIDQFLDSRLDRCLLDVGMGYGIFSEEIRKIVTFDRILGIEPSPFLANVCRAKGFEVVESPVEEVTCIEYPYSVAVSFEVVEHVASPLTFISSIKKLLRERGIMVVSTLNLHGFELLTLWDQSESVFPPHHINFFNVQSLKALFANCGCRILKAFTPGQLDVDIVSNHIDQMENSRFLRRLLTQTSETVKADFQQFLQNNNLSSHMWVVAQKVDN